MKYVFHRDYLQNVNNIPSQADTLYTSVVKCIQWTRIIRHNRIYLIKYSFVIRDLSEGNELGSLPYEINATDLGDDSK